jgi:heme/copper-type cytochrome/quinol oxidase subunit 1
MIHLRMSMIACMKRQRAVLLACVVLSLLLVVGGGVGFFVAGSAPYGWIAYAPLASSPFDVWLRPGQVWAAIAVLVGAVLLSGVAGFTLGLRRRGHGDS